MKQNKFEIVNINNTKVPVDLTFLNNENLYFNATEIAKQFNKRPNDFLSLQSTQEYVKLLLLDDSVTIPAGNELIITKTGGKHQGTWLYHQLALKFAVWCSVEFEYGLYKWIVQKISDEKQRKIDRQLAKMEYPYMTLAIKDDHADPQSYHYSNEADMINRIVLGCTAKKYCEINNIDRINLRNNLPVHIINLINELQKLNTCLIQIHMEFTERKEKLQIRYAELVQKLLK